MGEHAAEVGEPCAAVGEEGVAKGEQAMGLMGEHMAELPGVRVTESAGVGSEGTAALLLCAVTMLLCGAGTGMVLSSAGSASNAGSRSGMAREFAAGVDLGGLVGGVGWSLDGCVLV